MTTAAIVFLSTVWMIVSSMVGFCYFKMICRGRPLDDEAPAAPTQVLPAASPPDSQSAGAQSEVSGFPDSQAEVG